MASETKEAPKRITSIDAYRGLVMFLMLAEVLALGRVASLFPSNSAWQWIGFHTSHVAWTGCSLHDLIQPSFSFLVGVALPFSFAARQAKGQSLAWATLHATWRSVLLIFLGVFLRSIGQPLTYFSFEDTLSQIGLGYFFLYLLGLTNERWQWSAFAAILVGYWAAFVFYPAPDAPLSPDAYRALGVDPNWSHHLSGQFAAHFNINTNPAWYFDSWFLNLFPRQRPFVGNSGGYSTLSFIPTLATMILGLIAGSWMRSPDSTWLRVGKFFALGMVLLGAGFVLDHFGICPSVKKIWTPAWTLYSGGWCCLFLAAFHGLIEGTGFEAWSFPLVVFGANSIFIYCLARGQIRALIHDSLRPHLNGILYAPLGEWLNKNFPAERSLPTGWISPYETIISGTGVLLIYWLILLWMYRRKVFVKI